MQIDSALRELIRDAVRDVFREELRAVLVEVVAPTRYLSVREAGKVASVDPSTVRKWIQTGALRALRAGKILRVSQGELQKFMSRPPPSPERSPEELADEMFERMQAQDKTRCATCNHLPGWHLADRQCRARRCRCGRYVSKACL
jgi:excisionase family DNA binding protein